MTEKLEHMNDGVHTFILMLEKADLYILYNLDEY